MLNRPADGAEVGETVASMREYERAQKTVSQLIAGEVPARDIAIVGQGVRTIERVTGRLGYAAAARSGAINGLLIGLLLSAILVLGNPEAPIQLFVAYLFIGVAIGMMLSLVTFAIVRRRRDFASVTQMAADHYEVTVLPASLAKARQVLGGQRPAPVRPPVNLDEPPRYGERITPGQQEQAAAPSGPVSATSAASATGGQPVIPPRPADPRPRYGERVPGDAAAPADPKPAAPAEPKPAAAAGSEPVSPDAADGEAPASSAAPAKPASDEAAGGKPADD